MGSKRLGKGLEALITSYSTDGSYVDGTIPIKKIIPNKDQPRKDFDDQSMQDLTNSIKESGIIQPLTVRETDTKQFELIAGERRLRAAKKAGLETIPAYVLSVTTDLEMMEYALIENIQRVDLSPIEEAKGYEILSHTYGLSDQQIANKVGKDRTTILNLKNLLKLPNDIKINIKAKVDFNKGIISAGHARQLYSLFVYCNEFTQVTNLYQKIIDEGLSVRQTERLVNRKKTSKKSLKVKKISIRSDLEQIENQLISHFGTKVNVNKNKSGKGKIKIDFYSNDDLERIIEIITKS